MAKIEVDHPTALIDLPITIKLRDFAPRHSVTLTATQTFPNSSRWQGRATFSSDSDGCVDVSRQAPVSGTYDGVSGMGLFWSMERLPGASQPSAAAAVTRPYAIELEAVGADGKRAATTLTRWVARPGVTREIIRSSGIVGTLFLPPGAGPHPAVIAVSGGGGVIEEFRAAMLASHGYAALALGYFGNPGLPRGLVNIPLEYFERAIAWMRSQTWLRDHFLAVCGQSRGGELALLLGATFPEINAVIAWMPSGVVFWALGLAEPGDTRPRAAWTYRGKPLPFLQQNNTSIGPAPVAVPGRPVAYAEFYRRHLQDKRAVERAAIQVERTRGPILLVSGEDDQMWPSSELADIALRRLEAHRHPYPFQHLKYVGAGHTIIIPYWPLTVRAHTLGVEGLDGVLLSYGGTAKADAEAGVDAWRNTLAFLKNGVDGRR